MAASNAFEETAQAYADGVRVLFAASDQRAVQRGARGPASYEDLVTQAEQLAPVSEQFAREAEARLADEDPMARIQGATSLMAKALTDLEISKYLLRAAIDEEAEHEFAAETAEKQRSRAALGPDDEVLHLLLGKPEGLERAAERGTKPLTSVSVARTELSNSVNDAISLISSRAGKVGQAALGGLVGIGGAELVNAAGIVGMDIAEALGQAEKVTKLYELFRGYVTSAIESLIALVGRPVLEAATNKALEWINELKEGELFGDLLQKLYGSTQTIEELRQRISASQAGLEQFAAAIEDVGKLDSAFHQQIKLAEKLLKGLRFVGGISVAALPASKLILAGVYMILGVYIVAAGADYVDAPHLRFINRVPGVRQSVEIRLVVT